MKNEKQTHIWVYNVCIYQETPYLLLAQRKGHEDLFWHLACGLSEKPDRDEDDFIATARAANDRELKLRHSDVKFVLAHYDETKDSSWIDGVGCAHMIADFGRVGGLPSFTEQTVDTPSGKKGVTHAEWVKIADIKTSAENKTTKTTSNPLAAAASTSVFYHDLPMRNMVARILSQEIKGYLEDTYGPFRTTLPDLKHAAFSPDYPAPR